MGKFDSILICTDLDGPLYKKDDTVSEENRKAIRYFKEEGGLFTFITGRMPYFSHAAICAVEPNAPFGCINGGGLFDAAKEAAAYITVSNEEDAVKKVIEDIEQGKYI